MALVRSSAPRYETGFGVCSHLPHLHRDWAHPGNIHIGTGLVHARNRGSEPGLGSPRATSDPDWAHPGHMCTGARPTHVEVCTGTRPIQSKDSARPRRICAATPQWDVSQSPRSGLGSPLPFFFCVHLARPVRARLRSRVRLCAFAWAARGAAEGGVLHEVPSRRGAEGTCCVTFTLTHAQTHQHTRAHAHARTCTHAHA